MVQVKICGLSDASALNAATQAGADYVGLVFYSGSPRHVTVAQAAALMREVPKGVGKVGLFVDPQDGAIAEAVQSGGIDHLQLHGRESPRRVAQIRARFGLPVIKAIAVSEPADVARAAEYEGIADWLLFDAKPPKADQALPGGNGLVFDWKLIAGCRWTRPWMLSGGLNVDNLAEAVRISGARAVDVSSGVESEPGRKDATKVRAFVAAAKRL